MKLGVITDCFQKTLADSIPLAAELGCDGVQIYATTGEFSPEALTKEKKEEYRKLLQRYRLSVSALCGDLGGFGFEIARDNPERIAKTKRIIDLAAEFGAPVVTTHIGVIPAEKNDPVRQNLRAALAECGRYAAANGVTLAVETGPEPASRLKDFLDATEGGVGVNLDPANLVMVTGDDPVAAVRTLRRYIVHTHIKDGIMLKKTDPKIIYDHFARGGIQALNVADYFRETPVGEGAVDFPAYLAALREIGYHGYLTVERETGADPVGDIRAALTFLRGALRIPPAAGRNA